MKRSGPFLLLALALALSPAVAPARPDGAVGGSSSARPYHGTRTADVRDFGARPTDPFGNGQDNALAFQRAADSLVNPSNLALGQANSAPGILKVPSGNWNCLSPVFLGDYIQVCGEGPEATNVSAYNVNSPPFMFGTRRTELVANTLPGANLYDSMHKLVTNKQLTANVATLTAAAHPYVVGVYLTVKGVGAPFDGTVLITAVTTNTFSYACAGANVTSAACSGEANWPLRFAPSHRFSLDGQFSDSSCNGRGLYGLSSVMPGSPAVDPTTGGALADHYIVFNDLPPAFGTGDSWGSAASRELTLQFAIKGIGSNPVGHGPVMGMGVLDQQPLTQISPWFLTAGDFANNTFPGTADANQYHFYFYTNPLGRSQPSTPPRRFAFGNTAATGWQHISIKIKFNATDPQDSSGCCEIAVLINGTQVAVTRQYGTRNPTPTGTDGVDGEPSFAAADNLLWKENPFFPFCLFASSTDITSGISTNQSTDWSHTGGILKAQIGGLRVDLGTSPLQNNGVGQPEKLVSPNAVPTFYQKYFDASVSPATELCYLPLAEPPHNAAVNSDRLVTMWTGTLGQAGGGYHGHGWFALNEQLESNGTSVVVYNALRNITVTSGRGWGAAVLGTYCFHLTGENVICNGGWTGLHIASGYDYLFNKLGGLGADSVVTAINANIQIHNLDRTFIGNTMLRFACCKAKVDEVRAGSYNAFGMTTKYYVVCHGRAGQGYNSAYRFRGFELDNESGASPTRAIFYVERNPTVFTTPLIISEVHAEGIQNPDVPVVWLADGAGAVGAIGDIGTSQGPGWGMAYADIGPIEGADGFMVKTDGNAWHGRLHDSLALERTGCPNMEPVRVTGPAGVGNFIAEWAGPTLPRVGRYAAGACEITIRNPGIGAPAYAGGTTYTQGAYVTSGGLTYTATAAASNVGHTPASSPTFWVLGSIRKYLCVTSGTAAWDASTIYAPGNTVSAGGTEYIATGMIPPANLNQAPASNATYWTPGVAAVAPVWKPVETVTN